MKILILHLLVLLKSHTRIGSSSPVQAWQIIERYERNVGSDYGASSGDFWSGSGNFLDGGLNIQPALIPTPVSHSPKVTRILSLRVESSITARYVSTTVVTKIRNEASVPQDTNFWFSLSKGAFISDFFMEVNGNIYQAEVQEKEVAQKAYNEAMRRGQTASQVRQSQNDVTKFETDINLSPNTTASFHLTFQELLRRKDGVFQHRINLYPKEVVKNLIAEVYITEPQGIAFANITWTQGSALSTYFLNDALSVHYKSNTEVHALFSPSEEDQGSLSETGLQGDLVVTYDVVHDTGAGHIEDHLKASLEERFIYFKIGRNFSLSEGDNCIPIAHSVRKIVNGYFVHHICHVNLPATRKNVVFVIDTSGSMGGRKIFQTIAAMLTIIDDVREFDRFNIISFASYSSRWKPYLMQATKENKEMAKTFVNAFRAGGGTNLHDALMLAIKTLKPTDMDEGSGNSVVPTRSVDDGLSMIILLTDGRPNGDPVYIVDSITNAIHGDIALFSLAFGYDADYELLEKLSGHNQGLARKIYEDFSAPLQLQGFYEEVATPLLHHISVTYPEDEVEMDSLTKTNFIGYYEGTELVIAGKLKENYSGHELSAFVTANSFDIHYEWGLTKEIARNEEQIDRNDTLLNPKVVDDFAQRLWAYVTIKNLLEKHNIATTIEEKNNLRERALSLALKYKFVTPLTSLIVIKPDEEKGFDDGIGEDGRKVVPKTTPSPAVTPPPTHSSRQQSSRPSSGATGDPHILVEDPVSEVRLCFDIHGPQGTVVSLIQDKVLGVTVNGEMVEKDNYTSVHPNKTTPSFFGRIAIQLGKDWITIFRDSVLINDETALKWIPYAEITINSCTLGIFKGELVKISCENGVVMKILRHQAKRDSHDHFDLFLGEGRMFSDSVNGIVGQFQRRSITVVESSIHHLVKYGGTKAQLSLDGKSFNAYEIHRPRTGTCWASYVKNGLLMLETKYEDYILPNLYAKLSPSN